MFFLTSDSLDRNKSLQMLEERMAGALVVFEGWVRNHNQGKQVLSLEYQVYPELARKEGEKILEEARAKFHLHAISCTHRFGHLEIGETAVWVGATASHRDEAFRAARFVIDEVKHRLPIWKKEHYSDGTPEWVSCRDHHTHVHFTEEDYYRKQAQIVRQPLLREARVLVVGAGGLGCPVLTSLVAAGVGTIHVADHDTVDISNIHRQVLYSPAVVGEKKALIARKVLSELNPFVRVVSHDVFVDSNCVEGLVRDQHLVLDCTDNMRAKFLLHDACFKLKIPLISASVFKQEGQVRTFVPSANLGCLRCTISDAPDDALLGNCNDFGSLAPVVGAIGSIQASEAIAFLQNKHNSTILETFYLNLKTLTQTKIRNIRRENCASCTGRMEIQSDDVEVDPQEIDATFEVVDIRNAADEILLPFVSSPKKIAVLCDRGVRSLGRVPILVGIH